MRLRRSELSTPASNERMMEKAAASSADLGFLDLEDSVAPNEEVEAMINVEEIARSSPRLEALIFGPADYSASQGMDRNVIEGDVAAYPGDPWHYARNKIAIAARAAGIDAIDGAFPDYKNLDGYRRECTRSTTLGFVGKWAIHPGQIDVANQVYAPSREEVDYARKLDVLYNEAQEKGLGAVAFEGRMIDVALVRSARNTLEKAELIGM